MEVTAVLFVSDEASMIQKQTHIEKNHILRYKQIKCVNVEVEREREGHRWLRLSSQIKCFSEKMSKCSRMQSSNMRSWIWQIVRHREEC